MKTTITKSNKRSRKHQFKINDPIAFKWCGERDYGYVFELTKTKDGFASYTIKSAKYRGCIYYEMEVDDPTDTFSHIPSKSSKKLSNDELDKIYDHIGYKKSLQHQGEFGNTYTATFTPNKPRATVEKSTVRDLNVAIQKQKDFIRGNTIK